MPRTIIDHNQPDRYSMIIAPYQPARSGSAGLPSAVAPRMGFLLPTPSDKGMRVARRSVGSFQVLQIIETYGRTSNQSRDPFRTDRGLIPDALHDHYRVASALAWRLSDDYGKHRQTELKPSSPALQDPACREDPLKIAFRASFGSWNGQSSIRDKRPPAPWTLFL